MSNRILLLDIFLSVAMACGGPVADKKLVEPVVGDLDGIYSCVGIQKDKQYVGAATVQKVGDVYLVNWSMAGDKGIGIRTGDALAVSWVNDLGHGVTVYKIEPGPKLVGRWAGVPGNARLHTETLHFLKAFPEED